MDKKNKKRKFTLTEQSDCDPDSVEVTVRNPLGQLLISADGYGDHNEPGGPIVAMEIWEGELRLLVWADINREDPTHVISLKDAWEAGYHPVDDGDLD